jgi:pimeloyl-ACP methyl ester carboxylesterase
MERARIHAGELEYTTAGSGAPLLLIPPGPIANSFHPFTRDKALTDRYLVIAYHQRGQAGSTPTTGLVTFEEHAADAAALLRELGVARAHVAGHSTGASIAMQLAVDYPSVVDTLVLLEPPLMSVASAGAFLESVGPALAAYGAGERSSAMENFLCVVSGLDRETCRAVIDEHVPDGVDEAIRDADNFFGNVLAALADWKFGPIDAAKIAQPALSVIGSMSGALFVESHELLKAWLPQLEEAVIEGVGHLLHVQRPAPVVSAVAAWLGRHAMLGAQASTSRDSRAGLLPR